ncbi:MAG: M23 family peptidase, partial [Pseudonocardiaceae bacterium]
MCTMLTALLSGGPAAVLLSGGPAAVPDAATSAVAGPGGSDHPGDDVSGSAEKFDWPLPGSPAVVRAFQAPAYRYGPGHRGVDLAGVNGTPVLAAGAGTV